MNGEIKYTLYDREIGRGTPQNLKAEDVIDIPWMLMPDGVFHYSPMSRMAKTFKNGIGSIDYLGRAYGKGGMADFALTGPFTTQGGLKRAIKDLEGALVSMLTSGGRVIGMPVGHEVKPISRTPQEMQAIESKRALVEEISRIYGVPPTILQDWRRSTYSNMGAGRPPCREAHADQVGGSDATAVEPQTVRHDFRPNLCRALDGCDNAGRPEEQIGSVCPPDSDGTKNSERSPQTGKPAADGRRRPTTDSGGYCPSQRPRQESGGAADAGT